MAHVRVALTGQLARDARRDHGQQDVIHAATQTSLELANECDWKRRCGERPLAAHATVERAHQRQRAAGDRVGHAEQGLAEAHRQKTAVIREAKCWDAAFLELASRLRRVKEDLGDVDSRDAIRHAVVGLDDERLPPGPEAVDQVYLPERPVARQQLLMDLRAQVGQVGRCPTRSQAMLKQVRIEVERGDLGPVRSA